ncbi:DODA-type extradiol aromatic ring-opening family dioxygenase [Shewanella acanthi]|uniref:DODA-type extradiol aromatic ring-opening family dioxygenase n=1 Tax=Shewanella acanthi TaxID=2864212 RepID=UPI001C658F41|nr:class III extradiol ring-cleavage dioxygenase [Shewanella acanthi]QYJ80164.1 dioxygenase [Shewanella acanthi]
MSATDNNLMPVLFVPHGGGPLPLLNDANHDELRAFLTEMPEVLPTPKAIVLITAHWEEAEFTVSSNPAPGMIYDYYGFPPESYTLTYPAQGDPALATTIAELVAAKGIAVKLDNERGFDHGTFVPLKLMYPEASIPVVQVSLVQGLDPKTHIAIGEALSPLREQGVLIVGSGMSFHNMRGFFSGDSAVISRSRAFDKWLTDSLMADSAAMTPALKLNDWSRAPEGRYCHPREEHLLPLLVCFGAAHAGSSKVQHVFNGTLFNAWISGYLWQ